MSAHSTMLFERIITDEQAMMCSALTLRIGNNQGMGDVEYGRDLMAVSLEGSTIIQYICHSAPGYCLSGVA